MGFRMISRPHTIFAYILSEALPLIALAFLILTTLIFAQQTIRYSDVLLSNLTPFPVALRLLAQILPSTIVITLPISLLLGTILTLNRLSSDSEITAARASGISLSKLSRPLILMGLLGTSGSWILTSSTIPQALKQARNLKTQVLLQALGTQIKAQSFNTEFPGYLIHVQNIEQSTNNWLGVFLLNKASDLNSRLLTAQRGQLRITDTTPPTLEVTLLNGLSLDAAPSQERHTITAFEKTTIKLSDLDLPSISSKADKEEPTQEASFTQLAQRAIHADKKQDRLQAIVEWHKRSALPFACLALTCVAIPLGTYLPRRAGRTVSLAIGFSIAIIYYLLLIAGQNLSLSGTLPPWLGVWLANIICTLLALCLGNPPQRTRGQSPPPTLLPLRSNTTKPIGY